MNKRTSLFSVRGLVTLFTSTMLVSCVAREPGKYPYLGGPHYFKDLAVSSDPIGTRLVDKFEIEADKRPNYYFVGYFDNEGRLVRVQKYLNGKLEIDTQYSYEPDGKVSIKRNQQSARLRGRYSRIGKRGRSGCNEYGSEKHRCFVFHTQRFASALFT
jgi:hypothetical protein